jgi:3-dehydroquinate dehydratase-1
MVRFGSLALNGAPRIAVPFRDGNDAASIKDALRLGMHIAELRIDQFADRTPAHVLREIETFRSVPVLATIRSSTEGGNWQNAEEARLDLYRIILPHVDAVDVELSSTAIAGQVVAAAHALNKPVILSFHDFAKTPSITTLNDIARNARDAGADIVKVAGMCNTQDDVRTLTRFTIEQADKGAVVIGMGKIGVSTRVLFPALGSLFTFAAFGEGTAPGQLQLADMAAIFKQLYPE